MFAVVRIRRRSISKTSLLPGRSWSRWRDRANTTSCLPLSTPLSFLSAFVLSYPPVELAVHEPKVCRADFLPPSSYGIDVTCFPWHQSKSSYAGPRSQQGFGTATFGLHSGGHRRSLQLTRLLLGSCVPCRKLLISSSFHLLAVAIPSRPVFVTPGRPQSKNISAMARTNLA